jgi:hypothetical protein
MPAHPLYNVSILQNWIVIKAGECGVSYSVAESADHKCVTIRAIQAKHVNCRPAIGGVYNLADS